MTLQVVNPFAPAFITNPYPLYAQLRADGPILTGSGWVLSRHADVMAALVSDSVGHLETRAGEPPFDVMQRIFLRLNRPDHGRLRSIVAPFFTPRSARALEERARSSAAQALETGARDGGMDVVADLVRPIVGQMLADLMAIGPADVAYLRSLAGCVARSIDPATSPEQLARMEAAARDLVTYFDDLFASRAAGGDDLFSRLVSARSAGIMTREEAIATCILLLIAGGETTSAMMSTVVLALVTEPEAADWLLRHPEMTTRAIDEFARYDSPTQRSTRIALEDVDVNGVRIRAGEPLLLLFGAANRDPDAFGEPDQLDFARKLGHHLGFGRGMHYCLGAHVARGNGGAMVRELLRFRFQPAGPPDERRWLDTFAIRGLAALPIRFEARSRPSDV